MFAMIGIIGAMEEEVADLKAAMEDVRTETRAGMQFFLGKLSGKDCCLVCSGIGKVNAAACAQLLCDRYGAEIVMNTGIAGALKPGIQIGDLVLSTDAVQHDFDCVGFGYPLGVIPRMETSAFPADERLVKLAEKCCREVLPEVPVHVGRVASGDVFVSSAETKARILGQYDALCCEMEGAAIAQTAYLNRVPYLIVRAMSDQADGSAPEQYDKFQDEAISRFVKLMLAMVKDL